MRRTRPRTGASVTGGDRVQLGGVWYSVRTAVSDRNHLRHITGMNETTGRNVAMRLHPHQDFPVDREEDL